MVDANQCIRDRPQFDFKETLEEMIANSTCRCQGKTGELDRTKGLHKKAELEDASRPNEHHLDVEDEDEEAKYQIVFVDPGPSRGGRGGDEVPQVASEQVVVAS